MPMIDLYAPRGLFPEDRFAELGSELTLAVLRAEGVAQPTAFHLSNTATFLHILPADSVHTGAQQPANVVRIQVVTPPAALSRNAQKQLTQEMTQLVATVASDPTLRQRTWVILTEAAEGGWGIGGTAFGKEEFLALSQKSAK